MEGHVVTTNPWLVMAINMTVVFAVLIALGVIMHIIHLIDPTKKKSKLAPAPVAAPSVPTTAATVTNNNDEIVAAIVGAIVAMGYSSDQIASIRPRTTSKKWTYEGRLSGRN